MTPDTPVPPSSGLRPRSDREVQSCPWGSPPLPPSPQAVLPRGFFLRPSLVVSPPPQQSAGSSPGSAQASQRVSFLEVGGIIFPCDMISFLLFVPTMVHLMKFRLFPIIFLVVINIT